MAVAVAYFLIPQLAPLILVGGSAVILAAALYLHYTKFGVMEYERATWQYNLRKYSSYVVVAAIILGAYGFYAMNQGAAAGILPAAITSSITSPAMPSLSIPTIGGGMGLVIKTASSRIKELMRHGRITLD